MIQILKYLSRVKKNTLLSPLGLEIVLRILAEGAKGINREVLCTVLGISSEENALATILPIKEGLEKLAPISVYKNQTLLEYAPSMQARSDFLEKIRQVLPFYALQADATTADFTFRLENSFSIEGEWEKRFYPVLYKTEFFTLKNGEKVETTFILQSSIYGGNKNLYYKTEDFHAVQLPLKGGQLCLEVYLPYEKDGLEPMLEYLEGNQLQKITDQFEVVDAIEVVLPKFRLEEKFKLNDALKNLGLSVLYELSDNFSPAFTSEVPLKIEEVRQEVTFEIDERGLKVGAKTVAVGAGAGSIPITLPYILFEANQPFLYLVREKETESTLFIGLYEEPDRQQDFAVLHENEQRSEFWTSNSVYISNRMILVVFLYTLNQVKNHRNLAKEAYADLVDQLCAIIEASKIVQGRMLIKKVEEKLRATYEELVFEEDLLVSLFENLIVYLEKLKDKKSRRNVVGLGVLYDCFYQLRAMGALLPSTNLLAQFEKSIEGDAWGPIIPRSMLSNLDQQTLLDPGLGDRQIWNRLSTQQFRRLKPKVVPLSVKAKVYLSLMCLNRVATFYNSNLEAFKPLISDILHFVSEEDNPELRIKIGALRTFGTDYQTGIYSENEYFTKEEAAQIKYSNLNVCNIFEKICQSVNYYNQMVKNPDKASVYMEWILQATLSNLETLQYIHRTINHLGDLEKFTVEEGKNILGAPIEMDTKQINYLLDK